MACVTTLFYVMNKFLSLLSVFTLSCGALILLFYLRRSPAVGSFIRVFPPHAAGIANLIDLPASDLYIAGITPTQVYLGSYSNLDEIVTISYVADSSKQTGDLQRVPFFRNSGQSISVGTRSVVDSPRYYLLDAIWANVHIGEFGNSKLHSHQLSDRPFTRALPLSSASYIVMAFDSVARNNALMKVSTDQRFARQSVFILKKQLDGQFCTQGSLTYDSVSQSLFFTYRYRNQMIALDTNLRLRYQAKTIDPIDEVQLELDTLITDGIYRVTFKAPPVVVNNLTSVSSPYYYVQSAIQSEHEDPQLARKSSVVDVYEVKTGRYAYSFYLPNYDGISFSDFRVCHNQLVAIYGSKLFVYRLRD